MELVRPDSITKANIDVAYYFLICELKIADIVILATPSALQPLTAETTSGSLKQRTLSTLRHIGAGQSASCGLLVFTGKSLAPVGIQGHSET